MRPDGTRSPYSSTEVLKDGLLTLEIPFASNDRKGTWTVLAREMISQVSSAEQFLLSEKEETKK